MGNGIVTELSALFSASELDASLEAAFLLKATGIVVAGFTRSPVPEEVVSVMGATLWSSVDTMVRTLGGRPPRSIMLEVDERRIYAQQVPPNWTLLLVAPRSEGKRRLRREANRILGKLPATRSVSLARPVPAEVLE